MPPTLADLRRYAATRTLPAPTTLARAIDRMGFVQADPIRAPARAQDLTLRHRVRGYRAGDLERRYASLGVEEEVFVNYGFVSRTLHDLMHPRAGFSAWSASRKRQAAAILEFVRSRGLVHPREVDDHFSHGRVKNYWGGSSNATTQLLDAMHYRGLLRVARREKGIRIYAVRKALSAPLDTTARDARLDALVDVLVNLYAPLPARSLSGLVRRLRYGVPQWHGQLSHVLARATRRLSHANVNGVRWYWPANELVRQSGGDDASFNMVRFLAPFDPIVWDRSRFELLWNWAYRFEAYTPKVKRVRGYYALPLLWRDRIIGWGNLSVQDGELHAALGYVAAPPRDRAFARALDEELERLRAFLEV